MQASRIVLSISTALALSMGGCGDGATMTTDGGSGSAKTYMPFSLSNFAGQRARVALYEEIVAIRTKADFAKMHCGDPDAQPAAGTIAEVYLRNDSAAGVFRDKIKTLTGEHDYDKGAPIGVKMDEIITAALKGCEAGTLAPKIAGQLVEKTLQWFFYGETFEEAHDASEGTEIEEKWDEAFGYYGRSADGASSLGISGTAKKVDEEFQVTLNDTLFGLLIKGRGEAAAMNTTALKETVASYDKNLLIAFAYITAHEFDEFAVEADPAEELAEGKAFFNIIEAYMKTVAPTDAQYIRDQIDKTTYEMAKSIDATGIISRIEKAFGIKISK